MEHRPRRPTSGPAALGPGIAGMLRRLRLFPLHSLTARTGIARRLHEARTRKSEAILAARGHTRLLADRHADALPQDAADLVYLYDLVSRRRPARAIELGSGQSTIFIAQGLHDMIQVLRCAGTAFLEATYGLHRATKPIARPRLAFSALYTMRPTIYGPAKPLRARTAEERDLSAYANQIYLRV